MFSATRQHLGWQLVPIACWLAAGGCTRANAKGTPEGEPSKDNQTARASTHGNLRTLRQEELSKELIRVSERILEQHADAPIGTEVPFSHGGRRYVARIEEHHNPNNEPGRPPGKHKGVTVLARNH
jgi:hypothetical protein